MKSNNLDYLPLDKLQEKNILVTGASGLIGSAIVEFLLENTSAEVYAMFRNKDVGEFRFKKHLQKSKLHFILGDVNEPLATKHTFHYIIHAASNANPTTYSTDPVGTIWTNINGTRNLLEYGRRHSLERFLYISSGEVYGNGEQSVWSESDCGFIDNLDARSCYPSSKRTAETLCLCYADQYNVDVVIARPCHTYGPSFTDNDNRAYAQFVRKARDKQDIILKSSGEQFRSWIYIEDCVMGILTVLLNGKNNNAYNIADEASNVTIKHMAETIAQIAGTKVIFQIPDTLESKGYSKMQRAIFDTSKLQELGWAPKYSLKQGLYNTIYNI